MKKILLVLILIIASCTDGDNCQEIRDEINKSFDQQIEDAKNNPALSPANMEAEINRLSRERGSKLSNAC